MARRPPWMPARRPVTEDPFRWTQEGRATHSHRGPVRRPPRPAPQPAAGRRVGVAGGGVLALRVLYRRGPPVGPRPGGDLARLGPHEGPATDLATDGGVP